ncbi:hypothetical protein KEJ18_01980 [Candidatus Bathyarchaeota archaeon]|nr:hypothetical protein [Candidatus Bathyarchaeota archaeon]
MVKGIRPNHFAYVLVALLVLCAAPCIFSVKGAVTYTVNKVWVQITINKDRSINLMYNITLTYTSGSPQGIVTVGMPKEGFKIDIVQDLIGSVLRYEDASSDGYYAIDVYLGAPIVLGQPYTLIVYTTVPEMLFQDDTNRGYWGMQFFPTTFPDATGVINSIRVAMILPSGVTSDEVKYIIGRPFDNVDFVNDHLVVYWERTDWPPWSEFTVGVSFPERYIELPGPDILSYIAIGAAFLAAVGFVMLIATRFRKFDYEKPRIAVEALGAARNLTAVEAAVVLGSKPVRVLTMILFGLIYKRIVMVTETEPVIKIQKVQSEGQPSNLRYYEIDFLDSLHPDGSLDEIKLAQTYLELRDTVNHKIRGYSRIDTVNYYKSVVNKAWIQVTQAGTPELRGDVLDQNLEWLLAGEMFNEKIRDAFPPNIIIVPRPGWWWYWHGPYPPTVPVSTGTKVSTRAPSQPTPIPGQDLANKIVKGLETSANNIVKNVQDFTNRIVQSTQPMQTSQSSIKSRPSCVCACAHCACACACVSCACACAHGGAR